MKTLSTFALAASMAGAAAAQTATVQPDTFAYRAPVEATGAGPFHQIVLPLAVYQGVQSSDLSDLRVFNSQGELVPHALLRNASRAVSQVNETRVPMFPIVATTDKATDGGDIAVEVRRNADGTLVSVRQTPAFAARGSVVRGVVLDASKIKKGIRSLRLTVGPAVAPFHRYTVETSDDLQRWRMLASDAQLVRMEHDGQRIERSSAEWEAESGKYLRILWADPQQAPTIQSVALGVAQTAVTQAPRLWSNPMSPASTKPHVYDYALPGRMPLEQLRINLPQANTLAPVQIQRFVTTDAGRRHLRESNRWETLTRTVVYRLQTPQGEVQSPDIDLHAVPESRLRLAIDARSGGIGATPPTVQLGFVPHTLVFLARGNPPFTLAWGAPSIANAALDIGTLVPGYRSDQELSASPAKLGFTAPDAVANKASGRTPESKTKMSNGVLWAVLIAGVLILGGMAAALLRQMKQEK